MAHKPVTLFVFIAAAGNKFFQAGAERAGLPERSCRSCLQAPAAQLLGNAAMVCIAPMVFRSQADGQSSSAAVTLAAWVVEPLLTVWLLYQGFTFWRQMVSMDRQPKQGACFAERSPQKGLAIFSPWDLLMLPACLWQLCRRHWQRRRLHLDTASALRRRGLQAVRLRVLSLFGSSPPASDWRFVSEAESHGLDDFHEALPKGFLLPTQVAAVRSPPEDTETLQRLLADRWWQLEHPGMCLESVPEDECLRLAK